MPVKLSSKLQADSHEARIEIVPLIDIMFFLLASFMLVSLSMVRLKAVHVNLPPAGAAASDSSPSLVDVTVDAGGLAWVDKKPIAVNELGRLMKTLRASRPDLKVMISGDRDARHGAVLAVLDQVRSAGIQQVAFQVDVRPDGAGR